MSDENTITIEVGFGINGLRTLEAGGLNAYGPYVEASADYILYKFGKEVINRGIPKDVVVRIMEAKCLEVSFLNQLREMNNDD